MLGERQLYRSGATSLLIQSGFNPPLTVYFLNCEDAFSKAFFIDAHAVSTPVCMCCHADSLAARISCNFLFAASRLARIAIRPRPVFSRARICFSARPRYALVCGSVHLCRSGDAGCATLERVVAHSDATRSCVRSERRVCSSRIRSRTPRPHPTYAGAGERRRRARSVRSGYPTDRAGKRPHASDADSVAQGFLEPLGVSERERAIEAEQTIVDDAFARFLEWLTPEGRPMGTAG